MKKVKKVVIAGGGTAGWIAAAALAKGVGKSVDITLVESDAVPTVGVGEATIPPMITLHNILELEEREFVSAVNGTFKLGISFENWKNVGENYIHSFGAAGQSCWAANFLQFWLAGKQKGMVSEYGDYCAEHLASRMKKFAVLPKNGVNYAYHLDAGLYAKFLRENCEKLGVTRQEGKIVEVNLNNDNGYIDSLTLESGQKVEGDLFLDCSGFRALLINGALNVGYEDWSHWLPCDSAVAVQTKSSGELLPYTRSIARESGWQWRIPLQNRVGNGLVYCNKYLSDDAAREQLLGNLDAETINEPKLIKFKTGTRRKHWHKNCVAIGLSSGFLEPLESTSIHLIQRSVLKLVQLFPRDGIHQEDISEFNRNLRMEVDRIRDFIILHYKVTEREDSAFWRYCKNMEIPETLTAKIELFRQSGKIFRSESDLFAEESWTQVMLGQGIMPEGYHPIVDQMSDDELKGFLDRQKKSIAQRVDQLPSHEEFINYYCKSKMM